MKKINARWAISFIAIIVLLIFLHFTRVLAPLESQIYSVLNNVAAKFYSTSFNLRTAYNQQAEKRDLSEVIKALGEKVNKLTVENARLKKLEEENSKLRQHLKFVDENEINFILANVISRQIYARPEENQADIVIDKGRKDGLERGLVIIDNGVVIGKVVKVEENISQITLVTNSKCKLGATLQNEERTMGITSGNLGLTINMNFIPQVDKIEEGNLVVTSGLEENIPRGLVIGEITQVSSDSNEIWQSAIIEPIAGFDDLIIVSVVLP